MSEITPRSDHQWKWVTSPEPHWEQVPAPDTPWEFVPYRDPRWAHFESRRRQEEAEKRGRAEVSDLDAEIGRP